MAEIEIFNEYVTNRAFTLAGVSREFKLVTEILNNYPSGVNLPYVDLEGHETHQHITPRFAFGMFIVMKSLQHDLALADQEMLALSIVGALDNGE